MAWKNPWLRSGVIVLAALILYLPAIRGGFVWDDDQFVGNRLTTAGTEGLRQLWLTDQPRDYFPLTNTSFWLEWRLWGLNATGYHVTNVLLHAAAAVLLWQVLLRLSIPGAWLAGLIFAVHPVNVESVAWIAERKNTLSLALAAGSVLAWLSAECRMQNAECGMESGARFARFNSALCTLRSAFCTPCYLLALGLFLLALLAKTSVVMLPVVLLGCAWWQRRKISARDLLRAAPFFALSILLGVVTVWFQRQNSLAGEALALPLVSRIAAAGCAVWFYLLKAVAPVNLCVIYRGWTPKDTAAFSLWPALALAALFGLFWAFRKTWGRPFLFGLGTYVVMLLPVLGFFDMYMMKLSLVADRFQYPALIAVIALIIGLAAYGLERSGARLGKLAPVFAAALVGVLGLNTWQQAEIYQDKISLWTDTLEKNPQSWTAWNNLSAALIQRDNAGDADKALEFARKAVALNPNLPRPYFNIGRALLLLKRHEEALAPLQKAIELWPKFPEAHARLADALYRSGDVKAALEQYRQALDLEPEDAVTRFNFAVALTEQHRPDEAIQEYTTLLQALPYFAEAQSNLALLLASQGKIGEAVTHYHLALASLPDSPIILDNLAWLKACIEDSRFRDGAEALSLAEQAHQVAGDKSVKALDTLAAACAECGRFDDAVRYARQAAAAALAEAQAAAARQDAKAEQRAKAWAEQIGKRIELYQAHKPFRQGPGIPLE